MTGEPIGASAAWRAAAEAADGQCEHVGKPGRCTRTLNGGHRLYLVDGHVYCKTHAPAPPPRPAPVFGQDTLF
jgi:hypothetical protein